MYANRVVGYSFLSKTYILRMGLVKSYSIPKAWDVSNLTTVFYVIYVHELQLKKVDEASLIEYAPVHGSSECVEMKHDSGVNHWYE